MTTTLILAFIYITPPIFFLTVYFEWYKFVLYFKKNYISKQLGSIKFSGDNNQRITFTGKRFYIFNTQDVINHLISIEERKSQHRPIVDKLPVRTVIGDDSRFDIFSIKNILQVGCTRISKSEYKRIYNFLIKN